MGLAGVPGQNAVIFPSQLTPVDRVRGVAGFAILSQKQPHCQMLLSLILMPVMHSVLHR